MQEKTCAPQDFALVYSPSEELYWENILFNEFLLVQDSDDKVPPNLLLWNTSEKNNALWHI